MKLNTISLGDNEMTVLYFALNSALIEKDRKKRDLIKLGEDRGLDLSYEIRAVQDERDTIRTIQLQIPYSAIKF